MLWLINFKSCTLLIVNYLPSPCPNAATQTCGGKAAVGNQTERDPDETPLHLFELDSAAFFDKEKFSLSFALGLIHRDIGPRHQIGWGDRGPGMQRNTDGHA
ncbi:MAG: hypothetical protein JWQ00_809 [Noviherbaspirillum sp.]|nr:hypothetical protein [Noviherbaspirillum sp.]